MIVGIAKSLFFFVGILTCVGIVLLFRNNLKVGIAILFLFLFSGLWRDFSFYQSFRYYSVLIFYGLFLSVYAITHILRISRNIFLKTTFTLFFLISLLLLHIPKCIASFPNNYVLDLQGSIETILENNHKDFIYIFDREFQRLADKDSRFSKRQGLLPETTEDTTYYLLEHCHFSKNVYYILSEYKSTAIQSDNVFHFGKNDLRYSKTEHHFSNARKSKFVSVYRYYPFTPSPDIGSNPILENTVLKSYVPEYDTFTYQKDDKLIWLVGVPIDKKVEIIYHPYTDMDHLHLLPPGREKYGYDNLGIRAGDKCEQEKIGRYRVFEKNIPSEYPITFIRAGIKDREKIIFRYFLLD